MALYYYQVMVTVLDITNRKNKSHMGLWRSTLLVLKYTLASVTAYFASHIDLVSRYVWVPMWVRGAHRTELDNRQTGWQRLNPFSDIHSVTPPVEAEVRWFEAWSMSDLKVNQTAVTAQQETQSGQ